MIKKCSIGDVFALATKDGFVALQHIGLDDDGVEVIRVLRPLLNSKSMIDDNVINDKEHFIVRFPLLASYKKNLVDFIGNFPIPPNTSIPMYYRTLDYIPHKSIRNWYMVEAATSKRQIVNELTSQFLALSPSGIWNVAYLREQLEMGWTLENWK